MVLHLDGLGFTHKQLKLLRESGPRHWRKMKDYIHGRNEHDGIPSSSDDSSSDYVSPLRDSDEFEPYTNE